MMLLWLCARLDLGPRSHFETDESSILLSDSALLAITILLTSPFGAAKFSSTFRSGKFRLFPFCSIGSQKGERLAVLSCSKASGLISVQARNMWTCTEWFHPKIGVRISFT